MKKCNNNNNNFPECPPNSFQCAHACVPCRWRCDRENDCPPGGEDEAGCKYDGTDTCSNVTMLVFRFYNLILFCFLLFFLFFKNFVWIELFCFVLFSVSCFLFLFCSVQFCFCLLFSFLLIWIWCLLCFSSLSLCFFKIRICPVFVQKVKH